MSYRVIPRAEISRERWNGLSGGWWWHTGEWIDYCVAYCPGAIDESVAFLTMAGRVAGVAPLILEPSAEGLTLTMGGEPCIGPVGQPDVWVAYRNHLYDLLKRRSVVYAALRTSPLGAGGGVKESREWKDISWRSRIVDLDQPESDLRASLRKSYKALIRLGLREKEIVTSAEDSGPALAYAHCHQRVHNIPPPATYSLMGDWVDRGHGFIVAAKGDPWAGAAYFITYEGAAYYVSSACPEPDISYALVWTAMLRLKQMGVTRLELGWQGRARDEKGKSVEFFKRGFGGADEPVYAVEWCPKQPTILEETR